jgi:hypothetical protein
VAAAPGRYRDVVAEIGRAVQMTTNLHVVEGYLPGWVGVQCESREEAAWLQFAVNAENVSARRRLASLQLPAGPDFRAEKEIKNVVVALAKTYHYWDGHLTATEQSLAGGEVWEPATPAEAAAAPSEYEVAVREVEEVLRRAGLPTSPRRYIGWVGVETMGEEEAVWLLRAILVEQVLARREDTVLCLPIGATPDAGQTARVSRAFRQAWGLRAATSPHRPAWRRPGSLR